ncbi:MAG: DegT/DnrJ/EryC1/StrS family aminotransferase [Promethearchaeota archaeon]
MEKVVLFYPHVTERMRQRVNAQLHERFIGQGPAVDQFEAEFSKRFCASSSVAATGAGTDALHLAYLLAGIGRDHSVICPLFTCSATTIPLLYIGAKPVFADVQPNTLNVDTDHVRNLVSEKTKAIICVHYGGLPCDMDELRSIAYEAGIPLIEDAAHAIGASYKGQSIGSISDFTMFSFQAIKSITTGDGGMLAFKNNWLLPKAKRLRWFGIDREAKLSSNWDNDIWELGYKYQMTDIAASMGLAALEDWEDTFAYRRSLFENYQNQLADINDVTLIGDGYNDRIHAAWLCTVLVEDRVNLQRKLAERGIESGQVHYRNDRYSIFKDSRGYFPNMDAVEDNYLVLPMHMMMDIGDVERICDVLREGW